MSLSKKNIIYVALVLLSVGLIFFHDRINNLISDFLDSTNDQVIATLSEPTGTVRFKAKKTMQVKSAFDGRELRNFDTIYTERNSTAKITFVTDDQILVMPNSEIVIELPKDASDKGNISVTFLKGNFKVLKKSKSSSAAKKQITFIKGNVQRTIASLSIAAPQPEPEVTQSPAPEVIPEPIAVDPVPEKPAFTEKEYKYEIWNRAPTSISEGFKPTQKTNLEWSQSTTPETFYQVQVSQKEDFSTLETEENSNKTAASLDVPPGAYFARVRSYTKTQSSEWSEPSKVRVLNAPPTNLQHSNENSETYLDWKGNSSQAGFELEVRDPNNHKSTFYLNRNHHIYLPEADGKYSWRVREVNNSKWPVSRWSKTSQFDYEQIRNLAATEEAPIEPVEEIVTPIPETKEVVKLKEQKPIAKREKRISVKADIGMNTFSVKQVGTTLSENGSFSSASYTATNIGLGYNWNKHYVGLFYNLAPIKIEPESGITTDKDKFNLQALGIEGSLNLSQPQKKFQHALKIAALQETSPFFIPGSSTDVSILENKTLFGKLGLETTYKSTEKLNYVLAAAYFHPFSSSLDGASSFELEPAYSLLGSAGVNYFFSPNSSLGALFSYQKTAFDYTYSTASLGTLSGTRETDESKFLLGFKYLFFTTLIFPTLRILRRRR